MKITSFIVLFGKEIWILVFDKDLDYGFDIIIYITLFFLFIEMALGLILK
jgi:hypothetical protein